MTDEKVIDIDEVAPLLEPEPEAKLVQLTQARLDELIRDSMSRAGREAKQRAADLERENTHLKTLNAASAPDSTELEKTKAELSAARMESDSLRATSQKQSKDSFIAAQAEKNRFFAVDVVTKLTRDNLSWDAASKSYQVLDDAGVVRLNLDGTPLSADSFFAEYAAARPYLVKGEVKSGAGSVTGSIYQPYEKNEPLTRLFGKGSDASAANALCLRDPKRYATLRVQAQQAGLI
jgi:hypothetical protein